MPAVIVKLSQLWSPAWKIADTDADISAGRLSRTKAPLRISRMGRGRYFVLDGNHRAMEAIMAGAQEYPAVFDEHVPDLLRTGGAYNSVIESAVNVADAIHKRANPPMRRHYDFSRGRRAKYARRLRRNPIHAVDFKLAAAMRGLRQAIASESRHDPSPDQVEAMVDTAFDFAKTNWQKTGRRILPVSEYPKLRLLAVQRLTELVRGGELRRNPGILSGDGGRTAKPVRGDRLKTLDDAAWVAPDGDIYMVRRDHEDPDFVNHGKWAGYFFGKSERALEEAGWIKLQYGHWQAHPRTRPTDAQQQAMADRDAACGVNRNEDLFADNPGVIRPLPAAAAKGMKVLKGFRPAKQATAYTCGPACARAVLAYKGKAGVTEAQLAREAGTTKRHGTTPTRLCQTLADNGARIVPTKRACLAWCLRQLRQSRPVLLLWNDWKGHWVVLIGYDARRKLLLLADPAAATGVAVHAYDTFKRNWRTSVKGQVYRRLAVAIA